MKKFCPVCGSPYANPWCARCGAPPLHRVEVPDEHVEEVVAMRPWEVCSLKMPVDRVNCGGTNPATVVFPEEWK